MKTALILLLVAWAASGCTTKSQARLKAQQAFLEGQNAALRQQAATANGVTVIGPVQNSWVPWVAGLTLAQAIATANYIGTQEPGHIVITRHGESATVEAKVLLNGTNLPLEIGDVVEIRP